MVSPALRARAAVRSLAIAAIALAVLATATGPATDASRAAGTAAAVAGSGHVTVTVGGKGRAASSLARAEVKTRAIAPARRRGKRVRLPVRGVAVGGAATVALRGGIRFAVGARSLRLRALRVRVAPRRATVSARAGKRRLVVFSATPSKGDATIDGSASRASLAGAKLRLTARAAGLLRARLARSGLAAGSLGRLTLDARPTRVPAGTPAPGRPGGGNPVTGTPRSGPIENEPPRLARPAGAVDVRGASLIWRPRESWIQYVNGGEGTSVFGGAADGPAEVRPGSSAPLVYSFTSFPFASGWYDAASGSAAVYFRGGVGFRHSAHGIDFSASEPEIEIAGGASRAIFRFDGTGATRFDGRRGVLVNLHPAGVQPPSGATVTYSDVPGTIPADAGQSVFAGFYAAGEPFGTLTVSFTTP